jgi:hypothetical protein
MNGDAGEWALKMSNSPPVTRQSLVLVLVASLSLVLLLAPLYVF